MGEIIYWSEQKIKEQEKIINENINKAEEIAKEDIERGEDKMSSSEGGVTVIEKQIKVQVEGTQI